MSAKVIQLHKVSTYSPMLGCDPEFFFKSKGEVIGAEKVIPKAGLLTGGYGKFIIDGVQAELNPVPGTCRDNVASNIVSCFRALERALKAEKGIECDFSRTVEISAENLKELAEMSQQFGCAPSKSLYKEKDKLKLKKIDGTKYRTRAAGGHIHLGHSNNLYMKNALHKDHKRTVLLLDILAGNTSVLIDRDKGNIERRKLYGKAGEYRLPEHGLEYRTLSNFWLMSKPLMSFAFGMARLAVCLMSDTKYSEEFFDAFSSKVKKVKLYKAINNNDFDLAMENFLNIEESLKQVTTEDMYGRYPVNKYNIKEFHEFIKVVNKDGLEKFFSQDPLEHWTKANVNWMGFNDFLIRTIRPLITKPEVLKKAA